MSHSPTPPTHCCAPQEAVCVWGVVSSYSPRFLAGAGGGSSQFSSSLSQAVPHRGRRWGRRGGAGVLVLSPSSKSPPGDSHLTPPPRLAPWLLHFGSSPRLWDQTRVRERWASRTHRDELASAVPAPNSKCQPGCFSFRLKVVLSTKCEPNPVSCPLGFKVQGSFVGAKHVSLRHFAVRV